MDSGWCAQDGAIDISDTILNVGGQASMGISEMSIETMIGVSRLLIAASVMLAVLTVLLFWGFQIPKCIRMVLGGYPIYKKKDRKSVV